MKFLLIPVIRERYCRVRFYLLVKYRRVRKYQSQNILHVEYSESHFKKYNSNKKRVNYLVNLVNQLTDSKRKHLSLLVIGPRFESELYGYRGLGFKWNNIEAIDTFSYSPRITLGNMHKMNFANNSFDFVVCGWTIAYSKNPELALNEIHRVLRPNGIAVITWDLKENYEIIDLSSLSIHRKSDLSHKGDVLDEFFLSSFKKVGFKIYRIELGFLKFNFETPFAMVALNKI